jgi:DNA endonuclease
MAGLSSRKFLSLGQRRPESLQDCVPNCPQLPHQNRLIYFHLTLSDYVTKRQESTRGYVPENSCWARISRESKIMTEQTSHDSPIRERNYLPLDTRMQLYGRVRELSGLGLSYRRIQDAILTGHQVRLAKSTISVWVNGLHNPTGRLNWFRPNPTPALAYVIGVILGDGNLNIHGHNAEMILAVTDHDFAEEFSKCLSRVLHRERPYKIRWSEVKNRWVVQGSSILLYKFLNSDWRSFKQWIEHCNVCEAAFVRALYDGEGCMSGNSLTIYNTGRGLLIYIQSLLAKLNIEVLPLRLSTRTGTTITDPGTGRTYVRKRDCFSFGVRARSLARFQEFIGFTINRKQSRLEISLNKRKPDLPTSCKPFQQQEET